MEGGKKKSGGKVPTLPRTLLRRGLRRPQAWCPATIASAGEGILWAGAGMSAQSGMPTRAPFIAGTLQAAAVEHWVDGARLKRLQTLQGKGQMEAALNELVTGANRGNLISHYRAVYSKYSALSRSHKALTRIPLSGVVTTNYDGLLDCSGEVWASNMLTPGSPLPEFTDVPFLLKLYGDLMAPQTALLSQFEFAATLASSAVAQIPRNAWGSRTLLFVGCSLEGLLTDLRVVGAPAKIMRKHFAVVGVSSAEWEKQAAELTATYGIEVLPCTAETIGESLPVFLESLAAQIAERQQAANAYRSSQVVGAEEFLVAIQKLRAEGSAEGRQHREQREGNDQRDEDTGRAPQRVEHLIHVLRRGRGFQLLAHGGEDGGVGQSHHDQRQQHGGDQETEEAADPAQVRAVEHR